MKNFCEGLLWGTLIGACVGAVMVVKNKKLSKKLKAGLDVTEEKFMEAKQAIEEKMSDEGCRFGACEDRSQNNNFSKKNKNC